MTSSSPVVSAVRSCGVFVAPVGPAFGGGRRRLRLGSRRRRNVYVRLPVAGATGEPGERNEREYEIAGRAHGYGFLASSM
jgi:hypothetical protein